MMTSIKTKMVHLKQGILVRRKQAYTFSNGGTRAAAKERNGNDRRCSASLQNRFIENFDILQSMNGMLDLALLSQKNPIKFWPQEDTCFSGVLLLKLLGWEPSGQLEIL